MPLMSEASKLRQLNFEPQVAEADASKLQQGLVCPKTLVDELWLAKRRLDDVWTLPPPPLARSLLMRVARAQLFPHSGEGGKEHDNRAGDKLEELASAVGLLEDLPDGASFLDICGGPGAWSQFLLDRRELKLRGFGFTLRTDVGDEEDWKAEGKDQWYPELISHEHWSACWGADGTGDLLKPGNIEHCAGELSGKKVYLCVADGGFSNDTIPPNLLELYFYRLFLAEILMAISCLEPGGRFVCKLYTTFSEATASLLYLTTRLFEKVAIVKPRTSRVTGPERYLSCFGFRADGPETEEIRTALSFSHEFGAGRSPLTLPLLTPTVCSGSLGQDEMFMASVQEMACTLCDRQAKALCAVLERSTHLEDVATSISEACGLCTTRLQQTPGKAAEATSPCSSCSRSLARPKVRSPRRQSGRAWSTVRCERVLSTTPQKQCDVDSSWRSEAPSPCKIASPGWRTSTLAKSPRRRGHGGISASLGAAKSPGTGIAGGRRRR